MMRNKKNIKRLVIVLCIIALPVTFWVMAYNENNKPEVLEYAKNGFIHLCWKPSPQDSMLFNLDKANLSMPFHLRTSELRNDIRSTGSYGETGFLDYTSINITEDFSLDNIILESKNKISKIKSLKWGIMTRLSQGGIADSIILSYVGDSNNLQEFHHGDNFRSYFMYAKVLSIRYGQNEQEDISINQTVGKYRPFSIAFLKRDSLLYFIAYGPKVEKKPKEKILAHDYLGEFVNW